MLWVDWLRDADEKDLAAIERPRLSETVGSAAREQDTPGTAY